jgi:hypothetical protein
MVFLTKKIAGTDGEHIVNDLAYGLEMTQRAAEQRCVCLPCIMGNGTCTYEAYLADEEGRKTTNELFIMQE